MDTPAPSMENFSTPSFNDRMFDIVRSTLTPTTRCSTSLTERSGSLPMSSATTESTTSSAVCLMRWADCMASRWPTTTMRGTRPSPGAPSGAASACAHAGPAPSSAAWAVPSDTAIWRNAFMAVSIRGHSRGQPPGVWISPCRLHRLPLW
jgi:hypothetical protein